MITCEWCSAEFSRAGKRGCVPRFCSERCKDKAKHARYKAEGRVYKPAPKPPKERQCQACGVLFRIKGSRRYCSEDCKKEGKRAVNRKAYHKFFAENGRSPSMVLSADRRRALTKTTQIEPIERIKVYVRDEWTCALCGEGVDVKLNFPDPLSPSLDHIIPLARGGSHTYNNVQLAHLGCNQQKWAYVKE